MTLIVATILKSLIGDVSSDSHSPASATVFCVIDKH